MGSTLTAKKFLILGAGVTGKSVARSLKAHGSLVTIADDFSDDGVKTEDINVASLGASP